MELSSSPLHRPEVFISHANAVLTPRTRLRLARLVVEDGWTLKRPGFRSESQQGESEHAQEVQSRAA
ncbi:hypothetical protein CIK70_08115 [Brachybacterium alimentarium]|nr:hypothetical protein CIK70_08115 [Brachybacterium alimentarium]